MCVSALETIGRLSQVDMNEDVICSHLDDVVYEQLIALLMLHDIQIIVAALEALYQLSELGDVTTTRIAQVSAAVSEYQSDEVLSCQSVFVVHRFTMLSAHVLWQFTLCA